MHSGGTKTRRFLMHSGCTKRDQWDEMGSQAFRKRVVPEASEKLLKYFLQKGD